MILEACVNSAISAFEAQEGGANRVELCDNLLEGGTTPGAGTIRVARKLLKIDLFVMIRPRGADFLYNEREFEIMKEDIHTAKESGADGLVFGILNPDGTVDKQRMQLLVSLARPCKVNCHRAFDMTRDPFRAMEDLVSIGVDRILTSGQSESALSGAGLIRQLIQKSRGRIAIMPGNGVKEDNLLQVARETGATEFHIHLDKSVKTGMNFFNEKVQMGKPGQSEYEIIVTDRERVANARKIIDSFDL